MSKKESGNGNSSAGNIAINAQYIKDLSFESPSAPQSLAPPSKQPNIDINIDINAAKIDNNNSFEVTLIISATAKTDDLTLFIVEVSYSGIFTLTAIEKDMLEQVLLIYCPNMLFPFARRVVADITRDGGFPPLMLSPVDFASLYENRKK